jgi:hypothetical protein
MTETETEIKALEIKEQQAWKSLMDLERDQAVAKKPLNEAWSKAHHDLCKAKLRAELAAELAAETETKATKVAALGAA